MRLMILMVKDQDLTYSNRLYNFDLLDILKETQS